MSQSGKRWVVLVLAAGAMLAAGCMPPTRIEFIEKLAKENRKIARSTREFRTAYIPLAANQAADPKQVRSAYEAMQKTLKEVKADMAGQMLPPSSSSAKDFLQGYKDYLDAEQAILDGPMKAIVDEVEAPTAADGTPTLSDRWDYIKARLGEVTTQENQAFNKLTQVQTAYTSEHNYQASGLAEYVAAQKSGKQ